MAEQLPSEGNEEALRSQDWYGRPLGGFGHRSWMKRGLPDDAFDGRPMIGIASSWSDLTPCNGHLTDVAEHVKRGVWEAGGGRGSGAHRAISAKLRDWRPFALSIAIPAATASGFPESVPAW